MSGKPRPSQLSEADQLRELIREAHGAAKDLRALLRENSEMIEDTRRSRDRFFDTIKGEIDELTARMVEVIAEREQRMLKQVGAALPVNVACPKCSRVSTHNVTVPGQRTMPCKDCGTVTLYEASIRIGPG